jgi:hypothetical protein
MPYVRGHIKESHIVTIFMTCKIYKRLRFAYKSKIEADQMAVSNGSVEASEWQQGGRHPGRGLIRLDWTFWVELGSPEYGLLAGKSPED